MQEKKWDRASAGEEVGACAGEEEEVCAEEEVEDCTATFCTFSF